MEWERYMSKNFDYNSNGEWVDKRTGRRFNILLRRNVCWEHAAIFLDFIYRWDMGQQPQWPNFREDRRWRGCPWDEQHELFVRCYFEAIVEGPRGQKEPT